MCHTVFVDNNRCILFAVFPAAILQDRYFSADRPRYMNYASIGSIIGHEMTHGFDDQGRQYDYNGNLADWWDPQTEKQFLEKVQCIIDQYSNYMDQKTNLTVIYIKNSPMYPVCISAIIQFTHNFFLHCN